MSDELRKKVAEAVETILGNALLPGGETRIKLLTPMAVEVVMALKPYFLAATDAKPKTDYEKLLKLTEREFEVLQLIATGATTKMIAHKLSISTKTVEKHRQALMDKLDIHHIAGLTRFVVESGALPDGKPIKLQSKTGRPPNSMKCNSCYGTGTLNKDYTIFDCPWCNGKGWVK